MSERLINKIDKAISILIKATIFLLPLFFLPWTTEYFEFNKQMLLWLAMPLALFLWLVKIIRQKQLKTKTNLLNSPILIFLSLSLAACLLSLDWFSSLFGYYGRFSDAWLGLLSLVIFYFLLINTGLADSPKKIYGLMKLFIYAASLAALTSFLVRFGFLSLGTADPQSLFNQAWFNPAGGSLLSLSVFLAVVAVVLIGCLSGGNLKKSDRYFFNASLALMLLDLALTNFYLSWIILLLGAGLLMIFHWFNQGFNFRKIFNYRPIIPAVAVLLAIIFLAAPGADLAKVILGVPAPKEAVLDINQALKISREAVRANPFLGSGPGTFAYDFSLYRPAAANQGQFWQVRFDKSSSHFLEILTTSGLLTLLSYFLVISLAIYLNAALIRKHFKTGRPLEAADYDLVVILFTAFLLLFISQVLFLTNTVLNFSFWLFLGLLMAFWQARDAVLFKEKEIDLSKESKYLRISLVVLFLAGAGVFALTIYEIKFFAADVLAARATDREANLAAASKLNPKRYNYEINLAKFYLNRVRIEAEKPKDKRDGAYLKANIASAIDWARLAVLAAPNSVLAWETLGMIYRDVSPLTFNSQPWAVESFSRALALEPTNPVLASELAKAYLNNNDSLNAEKYFKQALELKPDYYEAKFGLAKVYLKSQKDGLSLELLNQLAAETFEPEIFYELGRFYYNHGQIDKAMERFKLVLSVSPNHANSLFSLGIAYEAKGETAEALKYYEKVLELNPGNEEVEKKINNLKK